MSGVKISQLPAAGAALDTMQFEVNDSGFSRRVTAAQLVGLAAETLDTGAGATGGGDDEVFFQNDQVMTTNYTIPANKNAMSTGPVTINEGVTLTIDTGARYVVI
jgi:hypothetical protein